jgi:hypothetical protein
VSSDGAVPVGAEIVGASPATAETIGRPGIDDPDADGVDGVELDMS